MTLNQNLCDAIAAGQGVENVAALLRSGADANAADTGVTPIWVATRFGGAAMVALLVSQGLTVTAEPAKRALHDSIRAERAAVVAVLLEAGVPLMPADAPAAFLLVVQTDHAASAWRLIESGVDVNASLAENGIAHALDADNEFDRALLRIAAMSPLTVYDARTHEYDESNRRGVTALMLAVQNKQLATATLLLDHGANVNAMDANHDTALLNAVDQDDVPMCRLLLARGAMVDVARRDGWHPVLSAGASAELALIQMLHAHGGNLNHVGDDDDSPIARSLANNVPHVTRWLMAQGVELPERFNHGRPALVVAARGNCLEMIRFLAARGDDLQARWPERDRDALMRAAEEGWLDAVTLLVELGADLQAQNRDGDSAYSLAAARAQQLRDETATDVDPACDHAGVMAFLRERGAALGNPVDQASLGPPWTEDDLATLADCLKACMPPLDVPALLESLPTVDAMLSGSFSALLDGLFDALHAQRLIAYAEWKAFYGELPNGMRMLDDVDISAFSPRAIEDALAQHGYPALPSQVPYFEYQNGFLGPLGLRMVTLQHSEIENIYMLCCIDDESLLNRLDAQWAKFGFVLDVHQSGAINRSFGKYSR